MTKARSSPKRNVERIRQKNLEDNQLFLEKLLMTNIRNDFVNSARSIIRKDGNNPAKTNYRQYEKVERATRYNEKVKSGEIAPHVPEWQRNIERKKYEKEQQQQWKEMRKQAKKIERQEKQRERELKRQIEREEKRRLRQRERELKRQAMENEREEKRRLRQQEKEMEIEEQLFEDELRKIEKILKFEEDIKIKRAERHRRHGLTKWELLYYDKSNPERHLYDFRHKVPTDQELID